MTLDCVAAAQESFPRRSMFRSDDAALFAVQGIYQELMIPVSIFHTGV